MAKRMGFRNCAASAIAIILGGLAGSATAAVDTSWAGMVRDDGWGDGGIAAGGDMIIFRRAAPKGPQGQPRLQLRYEYRDGVKMGGKTYLSLLAVDEYDSKAGRFRNLRAGAFTDHNAQGELRQQPAGTGAWETAAAGTIDAKSLAVACGKR
ncbi:MAG: surface-adhesin E family protein [Caulobacteraceae bacterium]